MACAAFAVTAFGPSPVFAQSASERPIAATTASAPAIPTDLRAAVERLRRLVPNTADCWFGDPGPHAHTPPEACLVWHERLTQSGAAATHAIGDYLSAPVASEARRWRGPVASEVLPRLVRILAMRRTNEATYYLAAFLSHVVATSQTETLRAAAGVAVDELRRLTSMDFDARAPWGDFDERYPSPSARLSIVRQWASWTLSRASVDLDALRQEGLDAARRDLASPDVGARLSAIARLARSRADREALRSAAAIVLADASFDADHRLQLSQLARRFGFAPRP